MQALPTSRGGGGWLDYRRMPRNFEKWVIWVMAVSPFLVFLGGWPVILRQPLEDVEGGIHQGGADVFLPSPDEVPWGLEAINAPAAWRVTEGSAEVVVAVIDSGIDHRIPELAGVMWRNPAEIPGNDLDDDGNGYVDDISGWDFRDDDPSSVTGTPIYWHGTFVASVIAAEFGAVENVGGVAPETRIMDLRFLDPLGLFYTSDWPRLIRAIDYAVENGARIINLSLYSNIEPPAAVRRAVQRAVNAGILVVGTAGNTGGRVGYFGKWSEVVAVGATDRSGRVAAFSNRGPEVTLVAPGVDITAHGIGGRPRVASGTSFAAAYVTGVAALLLSLRPDLSPGKLLEIFQYTSSYLEETGGSTTGVGLLDAAAAVDFVMSLVDRER